MKEFLTREQCKDIIETLHYPSPTQKIYDIKNSQWKFIQDKMQVLYPEAVMAQSITITVLDGPSKGIVRHLDKKIDQSTKKLVIYLTQCSAGTNFEGEIFHLNQGDALFFDLDLWHSGEFVPAGEKKILIGFRFYYKE